MMRIVHDHGEPLAADPDDIEHALRLIVLAAIARFRAQQREKGRC